MNKIGSILVILSLFFSLQIQGQKAPSPKIKAPKEKKEKEKTANDSLPIFRGIFIGVDLLNPIIGAFTTDPITFQASVDIDLKGTFFPVIEVGYMTHNQAYMNNQYTYTSDGFFGKIGINYNPLKNKLNMGYLYLGLRYGFALYNYSIQNITLSDGYFGTYLQESYMNIPASDHWGEVLGGIRVNLGAGFGMGFSIGYRFLFSSSKNENATATYIPGFGHREMGLGYSYSIYYKLPF